METYADVVEASTTGGAIDAMKMDEIARRSGRSNGGVACDVRSGPCSCGAWH